MDLGMDKPRDRGVSVCTGTWAVNITYIHVYRPISLSMHVLLVCGSARMWVGGCVYAWMHMCTCSNCCMQGLQALDPGWPQGTWLYVKLLHDSPTVYKRQLSQLHRTTFMVGTKVLYSRLICVILKRWIVIAFLYRNCGWPLQIYIK